MFTHKRENHIKRGTIREDGKVFWVYRKGKEVWATKEQYEKRENTRKAYVRMCQQEYKKLQVKKLSHERNYVGKYDYSRNLYFMSISTSGKEVWGSKSQLEKYRKRLNDRRKDMTQRLKEFQTNLKFGDPNPNNPEEFVCFFIGKKPYFGSAKKLEERKKSRAISYRKLDMFYKTKRMMVLQALNKRLRRGAINQENGLIFWEYSESGKEIWFVKEIFDERQEKEKIRRKKYRNKSIHNVCKDLKNI
jgi:chaperonin cofactor prefoldin